DIARDEYPEGRTLTKVRLDIHEAAGLLDNAVHGREAEAGALTHILRGEEGIEDLVDDLGRNAGAGILDLDEDILADRHAFILHLSALIGADIGGAQGQLAATSHGVASIDHEIDDHLLELRQVGLDRPEIALRHHVERDAFADQALQQHLEVVNHIAEL